MENVLFCRPDDDHWCVECCQGRKCYLLGDLGGGKRGCLGYGGKLTEEGLTQTDFCRDFRCLSEENLKRGEEFLQIIAGLPPGEFKMSDVLRVISKTAS